jgi:hypothetical protein
MDSSRSAATRENTLATQRQFTPAGKQQSFFPIDLTDALRLIGSIRRMLGISATR